MGLLALAADDATKTVCSPRREHVARLPDLRRTSWQMDGRQTSTRHARNNARILYLEVRSRRRLVVNSTSRIPREDQLQFRRLCGHHQRAHSGTSNWAW